MKLSATWPRPFLDTRRARERLETLHRVGRVHCFNYGITTFGSLRYYTLSPETYRYVHGETAKRSSRQVCAPISFSLQPHAYRLAEVLVHLQVLAHTDGLVIRRMAGDNTITLDADGQPFVPDGMVEIVTPTGQVFTFYIELDNATEPLHSRLQTNSLEQKVREYQAHADTSTRRFRTLFATTATLTRVKHFLDMAAGMARHPERSLFYGITVEGFLAMPSLRARHLLDHRGQQVALVQERAVATPQGVTQAALLTV